MKSLLHFLVGQGTLVLCATTALAAPVLNPSTGDNSVVGLALLVMGIAAVVLAAVFFFTRKKK